MWITFIATAIAASVCLSVVNLASEINKIRDVRSSPPLENIAPSNAPPSEQPQSVASSISQRPS
jgi:hypothetical protein